MGPSRRMSNGRSPIVNQQSQITSFFSKKTSSPSPSPSSVVMNSTSKTKLKYNPNPSPTSIPNPTTPSPPQYKPKKPVLVIGPSASPVSTPVPELSKKSYGREVVDRRLRVYWPLDKVWYEGCVKSFDSVSGKHLVQYDDADEELLNLAEEKVEWVGVESVKKFRRLRRISMIVDEEQKEEDVKSCGDDSEDEEWGKNVEKEEVEDVSEDMDLDDEEDDGVIRGKKPVVRKKSEPRKRKADGEANKLGFSKKSKSCEDVKKGVPRFSLDVNDNKNLEPKVNNSSK